MSAELLIFMEGLVSIWLFSLQAAIHNVQRISPILMRKPWPVFLIVVVMKMEKITNQEWRCLQSRIVNHGRIRKKFKIEFKIVEYNYHTLNLLFTNRTRPVRGWKMSNFLPRKLNDNIVKHFIIERLIIKVLLSYCHNY